MTQVRAPYREDAGRPADDAAAGAQPPGHGLQSLQGIPVILLPCSLVNMNAALDECGGLKRYLAEIC